MKSAVTISLVPQANGGPFIFWDGLADGCDKASAFDFDGVEIFPPSASAVDRSELTQLLSHHKLTLAAMGTGSGWVLQKLSLTHSEAKTRARARDFIKEIIDLAAGFGAPAIIGSMQGKFEGEVSREQATAWLAEALEELGEHASGRGQRFLYEPLNRYETNLFNRLDDTANFLDTLRTRNVRILADLFHMNLEETSLPKALRNAARYLGHVHFADSNRQAVGLGHLEILPIIEALREADYQGFLSAEVLPLPDSITAARQTIQSFRRYTTSHA
jgi:sugar phosphate isomerase/epimerase